MFPLSVSNSLTCLGGKCRKEKKESFITYFKEKHVRNVPKKRILAWTGFFSDTTWEDMHDNHFQTCKVKSCTFTNDRKYFDESDAILFHSGALSNVMSSLDLPSYRHFFQRWVIHNIEPPPRTLLGYEQLAGVFNWTAWYRLDSDIPVKYGGLVELNDNNAPKSVNISKNYGLTNTRMAAWMSSNCHDYVRRQLFIREMKGHLGTDMDLYGACGTKQCPETICRDFLENYKFFFTIENSNCKDYITEKFWEALRRRQVPIVTGSKGYEKVAPSHSYINADDFQSSKSLSDYLLYLAKNEAKYNEYLSWTNKYDIYGEIAGRRKFWCDLCEALHDTDRPSQVYRDLNGWVQDDMPDCPQFTVSFIFSEFLNVIT
ncbi:hypothetical protein LOTGIDRAFT_122340 [Lottia gigantea]|uniref:Fucosyltransferase n=1 Tax=Lottia gigantea TaxID=225164 RepID=V3ZIE5_LOTGI|nr:hypothetical protein LOTGIDRAFT_122340 [Lottia gigantea]ESO91053.1 hypothetical protein LOTGIDRAFT_122340 [Lottia gigantea]